MTVTAELPVAEHPRELRRAALGEFLKTRRAKLTPADVGLPPGARRRTSGLRREEVALLAGVGITWYTWLEQGRSINASGQVLDAIARTLRMDPFEREHLYQLAEATGLRAVPPQSEIPAEVHEMLRSMDALPATVVNDRYDIVARNDAYRDLFWGWHDEPCVHQNLVWCNVTWPNPKERLLNCEEEVPYLVARLRAMYGRHIGDPEWEENIRRLSEASELFARLWARHEVAEPSARVKHFVDQEVGPISLVSTELTVGSAPDLRMMIYTPHDERARELVRQIRGRHLRG
jgi:transcriptional regulator with XRE-family HTH domain